MADKANKARQERLFDLKADFNATGKSVESLLNSRQQAEDLTRMFRGGYSFQRNAC